MKKQVTVLLGSLLVLSMAVFGTASGGEETRSGQVDKNIRIKINDETFGDGGAGSAWADDEDRDVKVEMIGEDRAFIGINMEDLTEKIRKEFGYKKEPGVLVTGIVEGSAAEKFGLSENDIIYSFDGEEVRGSKHLSDMVLEKKPGDAVKIVYYREGKKKEIDLELGEKESQIVRIDRKYYDDVAKQYVKVARDAAKHALTASRGIFLTKGRLGLVMKDMDEDLASYFGTKAGEGVLVVEVIEDSPAAEAGLKAGDVIIMIGDEKVSEPDEVLEKAYESREEDSIGLVVVRKGKQMKMEVAVEDDDYTFSVYPAEKFRTKIEIPEIPHYQIIEMEKSEKKSLQKEIEALKEELKMLEERLEKIEKK
jgi:S1-C subfamily serine protease